MRRKKIRGCFKKVGDPARQFESQVELVVRRGHRPFEELRSFTDVVYVSFKIPPALRHGFIFIYLNLKLVLRVSDGREQRPCRHHQKQPAGVRVRFEQSSYWGGS
jgi:hypothetical protein